MTERRALAIAATLWLLSIGLLAAAPVYVATSHAPHPFMSNEPGSILPVVTTLLFVMSFATVGALLVWRRPSNPIGWLLSAAGLIYAVATFATIFDTTRWGNWMGSWLWGAGIALPGTFLLLLFPTGSLLSRRWRPVAWVAAIGLAGFVLGNAFGPGPISGSPRFTNPLGVGGPLGSVLKAMRGGFVLILMAGLASIVSLGVRYRRSRDPEREQMKWLLFAGGVILLSAAAQAPITAWLGSGPLATNATNAVVSFAFLFIPLAAGVAVLRYRLYDIDIVINRTLVYGLLAAFITAVYVAIVVGIGAALGRGSSRPNLALSILATAVVAVAFQPVRERVQRLANRLVYGVRATPYEVLAGFVRQVGGTYAAEDVLPRMARALAEGTGAASGTVWLRVGSQLVPEASWPSERLGGLAPVPMRGDGLPDVPGTSVALPVVHRGETLGALTITKPPAEPLTSTERKLAEDLAGQAGLVLRNVGLTEELLARLADIEASRSRIVSAEDEVRRRIERRIEEGTRRDLQATGSDLDHVTALLRSDPEGAKRSLEWMGERTTHALESLRDVARGVYPPLLADKGLVAALAAQASRAPVEVTVHADGVGRFPEDVESTIYFCCLEALGNVVAHAPASRASVTLARVGEGLDVIVRDDGAGFDVQGTARGMGLLGAADRLAALEGTLEISSAPGTGTTVRAHVPLPDEERALEPVR